MSQSFFGPTPGGGAGGTTVTVSNPPTNFALETGGNLDAIETDMDTLTGTGIVVTNLPATTPSTTSPLPVALYGPSGAVIADNTWSGGLATVLSSVRTQAAGAKVNRVVEQLSTIAATLTLTRPSGCSNFLYATVFNNSASSCTYTIGNSGATTGTVQAGATQNFPCDVTQLSLVATAANQQIDGYCFDPTVT